MQLKVMTMNLLCAGAINPAGTWRERFPLVVDVLRGGADIIALQEATVAQLTDIEREVSEFTIVSGPESGEMQLPRLAQRVARFWRGLPFRQRAPTVVRPGQAAPAPVHPYRGEHCAILYRTDKYDAIERNAFWVSHQPNIPGSLLRGTVLPRVVNWVRLKEKETGRTVTVFNAHLDFMPWAPLRSARILRQVMDTYWDNAPQILMGDFNAAPHSAAYRHLGRALKQSPNPRLEDAWLSARERRGPQGTYHGGTGRIRWMGRLDRILFRPHLTVERATTITYHNGRFYPSDHYPVLAELREK